MNIYRSYTHDQRHADMVLKEEGIPLAKHNIKLMNALENMINAHANLLQTIEEKGFELSHGADGSIKDFYPVKK